MRCHVVGKRAWAAAPAGPPKKLNAAAKLFDHVCHVPHGPKYFETIYKTKAFANVFLTRENSRNISQIASETTCHLHTFSVRLAYALQIKVGEILNFRPKTFFINLNV